MNEEEIGIEKQIISMINNILIDEDCDDEKIQINQDVPVQLNQKLLDLSSPMYLRKEKRSETEKGQSIKIEANQSNCSEEKKIQRDYVERSPKGFNIITTYPSKNSLFYNNYDNSDFQSMLNSFNSTQILAYNDNQKSNIPIKPRSRLYSVDNSMINQDNILESKMVSIEFFDEEVYETLRGRFLEIITNQNCSRILQNCLHTIPHLILSKILLEVLLRLIYLGY